MPINCDPTALLKEAVCYCYGDKKLQDAVIIYLLCQIANSAPPPADCTFQEGEGSPVGVNTPDFIGQMYHDELSDGFYVSTGLTVADWTAIGGSPGITILSTTLIVIDFRNDTIDTSLNCPNLTTVGGADGIFLGSPVCSISSFIAPLLASVSPGRFVADGSSLTQLSLPSLVTIGGIFDLDGSANLTMVSCPLLTGAGNIDFDSCPLLVSVDLSSFVYIDGATYNFSACALNAVSVEGILRQAVISATTTASIDLSGGTNAGVASLNAQGQADVVTLGAQLAINA